MAISVDVIGILLCLLVWSVAGIRTDIGRITKALEDRK